MRRSLTAVLASMGIAWCSSAAAQDAAPPEAAPVAAPPATADPAPQWGLVPVEPPPLPIAATTATADPQTYPRDVRRRMIRHEREITRLNRVMEREGPEYSEEMYESYRNRKGAGIALVAIGGVGLVCTLVYGFMVIISDAFSYDSESDDPHDDDGRLGEPRQRAALWTMLLTGITGIAVGVPLLVTGMQGKKRQDILRRKAEILAPFDPFAVTASLSLFTDSEGNVGGLRLRVVF